MIVPSIDIMGGRAVQLRRGSEFVLDGGDPLERLDEFSVAGDVAVVDLDAALGQGSNAALIRDLVAVSAVSKRRFTRAKGVERGASERRTVNTQREKLKAEALKPER